MGVSIGTPRDTDDFWQGYDKAAAEDGAEFKRLDDRLNALEGALWRIRNHWREFGPEHGFEEVLETACDAVLSK